MALLLWAASVVVLAALLWPRACPPAALSGTVSGSQAVRLRDLLASWETLVMLQPLVVDWKPLPTLEDETARYAMTERLTLLGWTFNNTVELARRQLERPGLWTLRTLVRTPGALGPWLFEAVHEFNVHDDGRWNDSMAIRTPWCLCRYSTSTFLEAHETLMERVLR